MRIDFASTLKVGRHSGLIAGLLRKAQSGDSFASALEQVIDTPVLVSRSLTQPVISPTLAARSSFVQVDAKAALAWQVKQNRSLPPIEAPVAQSVQPVASRTAVTGSLAVELSEVPSSLSPTGRVTIALSRPLPDAPLREVQKVAAQSAKPRPSLPDADAFIETVDPSAEVPETITPVQAGDGAAKDQPSDTGSQSQSSDQGQRQQDSPVDRRPTWLARIGRTVEAAVGRLVQVVRPTLPSAANAIGGPAQTAVETDAVAMATRVEGAEAPTTSLPAAQVVAPAVAVDADAAMPPVVPPASEGDVRPVAASDQAVPAIPAPSLGANHGHEDGQMPASAAVGSVPASGSEQAPIHTDDQGARPVQAPTSALDHVGEGAVPVNGAASQVEPVPTSSPERLLSGPASQGVTTPATTAVASAEPAEAVPTSAGVVDSGLAYGGPTRSTDPTQDVEEPSERVEVAASPIPEVVQTPAALDEAESLEASAPARPMASNPGDAVVSPASLETLSTVAPVAQVQSTDGVVTPAVVGMSEALPAEGGMVTPSVELGAAVEPVIVDSAETLVEPSRIADTGAPVIPAKMAGAPTTDMDIPKATAAPQVPTSVGPVTQATVQVPEGTVEVPVAVSVPGAPAVIESALPTDGANVFRLSQDPAPVLSEDRHAAPKQFNGFDRPDSPETVDSVSIVPDFQPANGLPLDGQLGARLDPDQSAEVSEPLVDATRLGAFAPVLPVTGSVANANLSAERRDGSGEVTFVDRQPVQANGHADTDGSQGDDSDSANQQGSSAAALGQQVVVDRDVAEGDPGAETVAPAVSIPVTAPVAPSESDQVAAPAAPPAPILAAASAALAEPVQTTAPAAPAVPILADGPAAPAVPILADVPAASAEPILTDVPAASAEPVPASAPVASAEPVPAAAPAAPTEPVQAVAPAAPTEPVQAAAPDAPAAPILAAASAAPVEPVQATVPAAPAEPVPAAAPAAPAAPVPAAAPAAPAVPIPAAAPVAPAEPVQGTAPDAPAAPILAAASAAPAEPVQATAPAALAEPVQTAAPTAPAGPVQTTGPAALAEPVSAATPAAPAEPVQAAAPAAPAAPVPAAAPVYPAEPVQSTAPAAPAEPVQAAAPAAPSELAQVAAPVVPAEPVQAAAPVAAAAPVPAAAPDAATAPVQDAAPDTPAAPVPAAAPAEPVQATALATHPAAPAARAVPVEPVPAAAPVAPAEPVQAALPAAPAEPVPAAAPVAPAEPVQAAAPAAPAEPVQANAPATPAEPILAATPVAPAEPVQVAAPAAAAEPVQAAAPAAPSEPVQAAAPVAPAEPVRAAASVSPAEPVPAAAPIAAAEPVQATAPVAPAAPVPAATPAAPAEPIQSATPVAPAQPVPAAAPVVPAEPVQAAAPAAPSELAQVAAPVVPAEPVQAAAPVAAAAPVPAAAPVVPAEPVQAAASVNMTAPVQATAPAPAAEVVPTAVPVAPVQRAVPATAVQSSEPVSIVSASLAESVEVEAVAPQLQSVSTEVSSLDAPVTPLPSRTVDAKPSAGVHGTEVAAFVDEPVATAAVDSRQSLDDALSGVTAAPARPIVTPVPSALAPARVTSDEAPVLRPFSPAAMATATVARGAALVEPEAMAAPAIWRPVVARPVATTAAVAGVAVPKMTAVVLLPDDPTEAPVVRILGETPVDGPAITPPAAPPVRAVQRQDVVALQAPAERSITSGRPAFVDAPVSPAWRTGEGVDVADPTTTVSRPAVDTDHVGNPQPVVAPRPPAPSVQVPAAVNPVAQAPAVRPAMPVADAPIAPWPATMALDTVTPPIPGPARRVADGPVRPGVMTAPSVATTPKEAVRGTVVAEVISPDIKNVTSGRMMVGAWQSVQPPAPASAPVRETGHVVPPLPVRLLNLALNVAQAGRRLDAPLLDGAVPAHPGPVAAQVQPAISEPPVAQPTLRSRPDVVPTVPTPTPTLPPETAGDEGGRVPQSPIDPVSVKPGRPVPVGIPVDAPVAPTAGDAFDALVTDEADDFDILADWPEEEAVDDEVWPDTVAPEAAAEFLMALGNVVAGQQPPVEGSPEPAIDAVAATQSTAASPATSPVPAPPAALPGPLPLQDHMAAVQATTRVSGTPVALPNADGAAPGPQAAPVTDDAVATPVPFGPAMAPAPMAPPVAGPAAVTAAAGPQVAPVAAETTAPVAPRPESRRVAPARRAVEPTRVRVDAADADLPIGLIPKDLVQPQPIEAVVADAPAAAVTAPASSDGFPGGQDDTPSDRQDGQEPAVPQSDDVPAGFVNPLAFTPQVTPTIEPGVEETGLAVDAAPRRAGAASRESEAIGPITVRSSEVAASRAPEAASRPTEPQPTVAMAAMTSQQLIDAVNDGVPVHFSQFPTLVEGLVASKPFVDKTVDVVLQPENLGRIRLEVSLVDGGTAIKVAIATQTMAAQQVFESYGPRMQQIVQSQGYTLKEFDVKVSDRPIRSEVRGQSGNDATGQRQNRRRRRGNNDDSTI